MSNIIIFYVLILCVWVTGSPISRLVPQSSNNNNSQISLSHQYEKINPSVKSDSISDGAETNRTKKQATVCVSLNCCNQGGVHCTPLNQSHLVYDPQTQTYQNSPNNGFNSGNSGATLPGDSPPCNMDNRILVIDPSRIPTGFVPISVSAFPPQIYLISGVKNSANNLDTFNGTTYQVPVSEVSNNEMRPIDTRNPETKEIYQTEQKYLPSGPFIQLDPSMVIGTSGALATPIMNPNEPGYATFGIIDGQTPQNSDNLFKSQVGGLEQSDSLGQNGQQILFGPSGPIPSNPGSLDPNNPSSINSFTFNNQGGLSSDHSFYSNAPMNPIGPGFVNTNQQGTANEHGISMTGFGGYGHNLMNSESQPNSGMPLYPLQPPTIDYQDHRTISGVSPAEYDNSLRDRFINANGVTGTIPIFGAQAGVNNLYPLGCTPNAGVYTFSDGRSYYLMPADVNGNSRLCFQPVESFNHLPPASSSQQQQPLVDRNQPQQIPNFTNFNKQQQPVNPNSQIHSSMQNNQHPFRLVEISNQQQPQNSSLQIHASMQSNQPGGTSISGTSHTLPSATGAIQLNNQQQQQPQNSDQMQMSIQTSSEQQGGSALVDTNQQQIPNLMNGLITISINNQTKTTQLTPNEVSSIIAGNASTIMEASRKLLNSSVDSNNGTNVNSSNTAATPVTLNQLVNIEDKSTGRSLNSGYKLYSPTSKSYWKRANNSKANEKAELKKGIKRETDDDESLN